MTEEKTKTDAAKDAMWEKAQAVIRTRILALREKQAAEKQQESTK